MEAPYYELCAVSLWGAWDGELSGVGTIAERLRSAPELAEDEGRRVDR